MHNSNTHESQSVCMDRSLDTGVSKTDVNIQERHTSLRDLMGNLHRRMREVEFVDEVQ